MLGSLSLCIIGSALAVAGVAKWRESIESNRATNNWRQMLLATNNMYEHVAEKLFGGSPISNDELLDILQQSLDLHREYAIQSGHDEHSRHRLSVAHHYVSVGYERVGRYADALKHRKACMQILEGLISEHPESERYRYDHFHSLLLVGYIKHRVGEEFDAVEHLMQSKNELDALLKVAPDNPIYLDAMATLQVKLAAELLSRRDDEWRSHCLDAQAISVRLWKAHPDRPIYSKGANLSWGLLIQESMDTGQLDRALEQCLQGKTFYDQSLRPVEEEAWVLECSRLLFFNHCRVVYSMERWEEFLAICDELVDRERRLELSIRANATLNVECLEIIAQKGIALQRTGDQQRAELCFQQVAAGIESLREKPNIDEFQASIERNYNIALERRPIE